MAKFLIEGKYSAEGLRGLAKDKASGRQTAVTQLIEGVGGKVESVYYALGDVDVYVVCDFPDTASAAAVSLAVSSTGKVQIKTIALMTVAEADQALSKTVKYRAPGA
jgi:uncharacterized protein with GYD domain